MRIYVGNMKFEMTEQDLQDLFGEHGQVSDVHIVTDRATGRPRGFAFVEMPDDQAANAAIEAINGQEILGRTLTVNEARPRNGGGGGGDRGGYRRR